MAELVWRGKSSPANRHSADQKAQEALLASPRYRYVTRKHYPLKGSPEPASATTERWTNRLFQGDRSVVLPALRQEFATAIKLIYIDPPFMTGRTFLHRGERQNGEEKRSESQVAYSDTWKNDLDSYLQWLYETLFQLYALLAEDGSLYVHLDWRATHYAKIMLDEIFGGNEDGAGFKNEIIWHYQSGGRAQKYYARKHESILLYTRSGRYCFHGERVGIRRGTHKRNHMRKETGTDGRVVWTIRSAGRVYSYDEDSLMSPEDVWCDISHLHQKDPERTGYATQKPEALLERILLASSEEHDLVLDCFCGSGVTPVVAERLGRRWIACDKSEVAITMTVERLLAQERRHPFVLQQIEETD